MILFLYYTPQHRSHHSITIIDLKTIFEFRVATHQKIRGALTF